MNVFDYRPRYVAPVADDPRDQEIRDLNDALTAANQTIAALRSMPLIPRADHDRAIAARDEALRQVDALTRQIQAERDRREALAEIRALHALRDVLRVTGRTAWGPEESRVLREASAVLAEAGFRAPEIDALVASTREWEGRR
jgi:hypothetical protein